MEELSRTSMFEGYVKTMGAYYEYRSTKEGKRMYELLKYLNHMAIDFCELHDITCCTREVYKHSQYQCKHNSDPIIASYQECKFSCHDIEQVEKYIAYIAAHEIDSLINEKLETSHEAWVMKGHISILLQLCIEEFSDNAYVIKYKEITLAAMESTNILQEEGDESISFEKKMKNIWSNLSLGKSGILHPLYQKMIVILKLNTPLLCMSNLLMSM